MAISVNRFSENKNGDATIHLTVSPTLFLNSASMMNRINRYTDIIFSKGIPFNRHDSIRLSFLTFSVVIKLLFFNTGSFQLLYMFYILLYVVFSFKACGIHISTFTKYRTLFPRPIVFSKAPGDTCIAIWIPTI